MRKELSKHHDDKEEVLENKLKIKTITEKKNAKGQCLRQLFPVQDQPVISNDKFAVMPVHVPANRRGRSGEVPAHEIYFQKSIANKTTGKK